DAQAFVHGVAHIVLALVIRNFVAAAEHATQPDTATRFALSLDKDLGNKLRISTVRQLGIYSGFGCEGLKTGFEVLLDRFKGPFDKSSVLKIGDRPSSFGKIG